MTMLARAGRRASSITLAPQFSGVKHAELIATVIRADGTIEELGVIAEADFQRPSLLSRLGAFLCRKP